MTETLDALLPPEMAERGTGLVAGVYWAVYRRRARSAGVDSAG